MSSTTELELEDGAASVVEVVGEGVQVEDDEDHVDEDDDQVDEAEDDDQVDEDEDDQVELVVAPTLTTAAAGSLVEVLASEVEDEVEKVDEVDVLLAMLEQRSVSPLRRRRFGFTTRTSLTGSGAALRAARAWCSWRPRPTRGVVRAVAERAKAKRTMSFEKADMIVVGELVCLSMFKESVRDFASEGQRRRREGEEGQAQRERERRTRDEEGKTT